MALSEAIQIQFDWDGDEEFDTIAGVPTDANAAAFSVAPDSSPTGEFPAGSVRFDPPLPEIEQFIGALNATAPDFEFKIPNVSALPGFDPARGFEFRAFAGSFKDDGIGEDRSGDLVHVDLPTPAPEPAVPVVSLTELIVSRSYFNFWGTAAGGVASRESNTRPTKDIGRDLCLPTERPRGNSKLGATVITACALSSGQSIMREMLRPRWLSRCSRSELGELVGGS